MDTNVLFETFQVYRGMAPYRIVFIRHGESVYNEENRFCGWHDADLSGQGITEAKQAGQLLHQNHFTFDIAYTSVLKRAIKTLNLVLDELDLNWIPVIKCVILVFHFLCCVTRVFHVTLIFIPLFKIFITSL